MRVGLGIGPPGRKKRQEQARARAERIVTALQDLVADDPRTLGPDHPGTQTSPATVAPAFAPALTMQVTPEQGRAALTPATTQRLGKALAEVTRRAASVADNLPTSAGRVFSPGQPSPPLSDKWPGRDPFLYIMDSSGFLGSLGMEGEGVSGTAVFSDSQRFAGQSEVAWASRGHTHINWVLLAPWRGRARDAAGMTAAYEQLLTEQLRALGPDDLDTLTTRRNLAIWRGRAGDVDGAAAAYEQLLTEQLRLLGPDHPDTLTTRSNLASRRGASSY